MRMGSRHATAATHTCSQSQASWNGAKVAVKIIVSDTEEKLHDSTTEAITGRMLAHPHVVNSYVAAVMSAQEVLAALEARHMGQSASLRRLVCSGGMSAPLPKPDSLTGMTLADEVERLMGPSSTDYSQPLSHPPGPGATQPVSRQWVSAGGATTQVPHATASSPQTGADHTSVAVTAVTATSAALAADVGTAVVARGVSSPMSRLPETYDDFTFAHVDGQGVVSLEEVAKAMRLSTGQYVTAVVVGEGSSNVCLHGLPATAIQISPLIIK